MRGLYIHIPFCKQACRYCDFFFSVSLKYLDDYVDRLVDEIASRSLPYKGRELNTLYLGGGTPSLLTEDHLQKILTTLNDFYSFQDSAEWTLECNPDDLTPKRISYLLSLGFNRLSVGIQSFQEEELSYMRRSHQVMQAIDSVHAASEAGFSNISIDLIYGLPGQSLEKWEENLDRALSLPVSHISAYHLTYEPGTVFDHWRKKGRLLPLQEEESIRQFATLRKTLLNNNFDHYELSNFARPGARSAHNLIYWSGKAYMGFGPSAHSYDGEHRSWNVSSLKRYLDRDEKDLAISEREDLSTREKYHDYLINSLRTKWGCDPELVGNRFGQSFLEHLEKNAQSFLEEGSLYRIDGRLAIKPESWFITDLILRELFME
jgi:oxygen-independent coproporphyrinogen-3 oxidase